MQNYHTPYHPVSPSPWPYCMAVSIFFVAVGLVFFFYNNSLVILFTGMCGMSFIFLFWFKDVISESSFQGFHTKQVIKNIKFAFLLFILSEIMFFVSFFWSFIWFSSSPVIGIGCEWSPKGIEPLDPLSVPLLNTIILLTSGISITWSHYSIIQGKRISSLNSLMSTIILGFIFTSMQAFEYVNSSFTMSDSSYGSCFFLTTGFHGLHVLVGTIFLSICYLRLKYYHFTTTHHIGFELASWYWHFVDVVWLFVYTIIYWWGSNLI